MLGEKVIVLTREKAGEDSMGEPAYAWIQTEVSDVLVRPIDGDEMLDTLRPDGIRVAYRIAFPKTYSGPCLAHARIALVERGMDMADTDSALRVAGRPDITRPCPTRWNMTFEAGRTDG